MKKYILLLLMILSCHLLMAQVDAFKEIEISTLDIKDALKNFGNISDIDLFLSGISKIARDPLWDEIIYKYNNGKYEEATWKLNLTYTYIKNRKAVDEIHKFSLIQLNVDTVGLNLYEEKLKARDSLKLIYINGIRLSILIDIKGSINQKLVQDICHTYSTLVKRVKDNRDILYNDYSFHSDLKKANQFITQLLNDIYFNRYFDYSQISSYNYDILPFENIEKPPINCDLDILYFSSDTLLSITNLFSIKDSISRKIDILLSDSSIIPIIDSDFESVYQLSHEIISFSTKQLYNSIDNYNDGNYLTFMKALNVLDILHGKVYRLINQVEKSDISDRQLIRINSLKSNLYYNRATLSDARSRIGPNEIPHHNYTTYKNKAIKYLDTMFTISSKLYPLEGEMVSLELETIKCLNAMANVYKRMSYKDKLGDIYKKKYTLPISNIINAEARYVADAIIKERDKMSRRGIRVAIVLFLMLLFTFWRIVRARSQLSVLQIETQEKVIELTTLEQDFGQLTEAHKIIRTQKDEADETNKQLQLEQHRVNKYRRAMSHRIKNGLGGISSRLDLIKSSLSPVEDNTTSQRVIKEIKSRVNTMLELHTLLNQKVDTPFIDLKDFIGKMRDIYNMYNDYEAENYHFEAIDFSLPLRPEIVQDMGLIIDELISNAWVHSRYRPRYLKVLILKTGEQLIIEVQDTENIYSKNKEIIYDRSTKNKLRKASDESQKSKGHTIITNIARRYKGTFGRICNDDGIGSNYFVHFNINNLDYE